MRIHSIKSSINIFRRAAAKASVEGFGSFNAAGLKFLAASSRVAPAPVIHAVARQIRHLSKDLILPFEDAPLQRHLEQRRRDDIALNINVLGEAVLGEREAEERLQRVIEMIRRPHTNYVSVKLSSVVSQIITIDRVGSLERVTEKMRILYREAEQWGAFVNLDMEEYRDLELTVAAFKKVLVEPEFCGIDAGIVLQAYLPESHAVFADLVAWSPSPSTELRWHDQSSIGERRQPGHGNDRGRTARLERRALSDQGRRRRQLRATDRRRAAARARRRRSCRRRQPQPLPSLLGARSCSLREASSHRSTSRCSKVWPIPSRSPSPRPVSASCSTPRSLDATTSPRPSPTSCVDSTRTRRTRTT